MMEMITSRSPALPAATAVTGPPWAVSGGQADSPVTASQTPTVPSSLPEMITSWPPARPAARLQCVRSADTAWPAVTFQCR